jgi:predicted enzyme related to lactoylglutathione lyase
MSSEQQRPRLGTIGWVDLTVRDAEAVRDFYRAVVGWRASEVAMGEYTDYAMHPVEGEPPVAGVCHARGVNAALPPAWLIYLVVADLDRSLAECLARGGKVVVPARSLGEARYAVIADPAGAVAALYQA